MTKDEVNKKALNLSKQYNDLLLEHCTGLGKTKSALDIVSELPGKGYIILAEKTHIKNWVNQIHKFNKDEILSRSKIFLYASLHKYEDTKVDWIILDEAHHLSDKRTQSLSTIKSQNNILLSATIENNQIYNLKHKLFPKLHIDTIPLDMGIDWGLIPAPEINIIPLTLNNSISSETIIIKKGTPKNYIKVNCRYNERFKYLKQYKDIELTISCTQTQKYQYFEDNINYWKEQYLSSYIPWKKNKWLNLTSQRKTFLSEIKTPHVSNLIIKLNREKKRYICFTGSIKQCELLGSNDNIIHSESNTNNQTIIDNFNSNKIHSLFTVKMLQEGTNLHNIEVGVISQLDGNLRAYTQKAGRVFRSNKPIQYIFYFKNTRDEEYLDNALEGLKKYIKYEN